MKPFLPDAGGRAETSQRKAKAVEKFCAKCGCGIERRKTYCGPCYDIRYNERVAANRLKAKNAKGL